MESYALYLLVTVVTIVSPGPGVLLTLTNALRFGFWGAIAGILGIAVGIFVVALLSASSVALILASSEFAFNLLRFLGAAYLMYLGVQLWRSHSGLREPQALKVTGQRARFLQGVMVTVLNPKAIFFFVALFPQFIDVNNAPTAQFLGLVLTYCGLVLLIHAVYAGFAKAAKTKLSSPQGQYWIAKISGVFHMLLGLGLAMSGQTAA